MTRSRWHMQTEDGQVTVCRHLPARFDVSAITTLPKGRAIRYAHQIRQDMWRALQRVRGFSPAVRLTALPEGWSVQAGGRIAGRAALSLEARVQDVLEDPHNRMRWIAHANRRTQP